MELSIRKGSKTLIIVLHSAEFPEPAHSQLVRSALALSEEKGYDCKAPVLACNIGGKVDTDACMKKLEDLLNAGAASYDKIFIIHACEEDVWNVMALMEGDSLPLQVSNKIANVGCLSEEADIHAIRHVLLA